MTRATIRLLFVIHDTNRAGAQLVQLRLLQWLRQNADFEFDVLLRRGGPLADDFRAVANQCFTWQPPPLSDRLPDRLRRAVLRRLKLWRSHQGRLLAQLQGGNYALIFANSAACTDILSPIHSAVNCPVILRVAELETAFHRYCEPSALNHWLAKADKIIAVSDLVRDNLINRHHVTPARIQKIPGFPPPTQAVASDVEIAALRTQLGIPQNAFIVGACGSLEWRKGADLFVQVAHKTVSDSDAVRPIHFIWIGGQPNSIAYQEYMYDVKQLGVESQVHLIGTVTNPQDYFLLFDLFLMTSREDPFPVVCLEAGQAGCPIICFENGVGSTEFVNETNGAIVPYLDITAMSAAVLRFYREEDLLQQASENIQLAVKPYTLEQSAAKILALINATLPDTLPQPVLEEVPSVKSLTIQ